MHVFVQAPQLALAAAFVDSLIAQQDRHANNSRWDAARQTLGLFDHGYSFALPAHRLNGAWFVGWRWAVGREALDQSEIDALERLLRSGDLFGLRVMAVNSTSQVTGESLT